MRLRSASPYQKPCIAALQLLADTPEKRKIAVLAAMKQLKERCLTTSLVCVDFRRCWKD